MRKTLNEPGFWMMVFGTVIIAMFLFAGNGECAERTVVAYDYGPLTYVIEFEQYYTDEGAVKYTKYYHLIGQTGEKPMLVGVTKRMPTTDTLAAMMSRYLMIMTNGGM